MQTKLLLTFISLLVLSLTGCDDLFKEVITVETDYFEMDFSVQASDLQGFQIFSEEVFNNEIENAIEDAGILKDLLQAVYLKEADVAITSQGAYTNFNVLKFVELTIYNDSLGDEKVAFKDPISQGISTLNLDVGSDNLLPYFQGESFILTAQGYLRERIYENVDLHARVKFQLKGGVK